MQHNGSRYCTELLKFCRVCVLQDTHTCSQNQSTKYGPASCRHSLRRWENRQNTVHSPRCSEARRPPTASWSGASDSTPCAGRAPTESTCDRQQYRARVCVDSADSTCVTYSWEHRKCTPFTFSGGTDTKHTAAILSFK